MIGYLITAFAGIFWLFRLIITLMYEAQVQTEIMPINMTMEITLLFITFACIILIAKRKMIGAVIYLISQTAYFGVQGYKTLQTIIEGQAQNSNYVSLLIALIAILIPILAIINIGLNTGKKGSVRNKNTDWFYGTTEHDRVLDDRADKNQYKF